MLPSLPIPASNTTDPSIFICCFASKGSTGSPRSW
jgi:hypothetical protein